MSKPSLPAQIEEQPWEDPLSADERAKFYRGLTDEVHLASKKKPGYIHLTEALRRALTFYFGDFVDLIPDTSQKTIYTLIKSARKGESRVVEMIKEKPIPDLFFGELRAYATKIARRALGRQLQDRGRYTSIEDLDSSLEDRHESSSGRIFTEETRQTVREVMLRADPREVQNYWAFHVDGLTDDQIAELDDRTPAAVKQARYRFVKEIRRELWKTHEECKSK